jgi:hypothetical protein
VTEAWRVVENQYENSTRKLVDSDEEQALLEQLIDQKAKPPRPAGPEFKRLSYLLYTPFRHPPLRRGTRFGRRDERSLFYGAREIHTALAEVAYYRLLFLEGTRADLSTTIVRLSAFTAKIDAAKAMDFTVPPFDAHRAAISSKTSYSVSQELGRAMREAAIDACSFFSARDLNEGVNYALFTPCFASKTHGAIRGWSCVFNRKLVEMKKTHGTERYSFPRSQFEVMGALPNPGV